MIVATLQKPFLSTVREGQRVEEPRCLCHVSHSISCDDHRELLRGCTRNHEGTIEHYRIARELEIRVWLEQR